MKDLIEIVRREYELNDRRSLKTAWHHAKPVLRLLGEQEAQAVNANVIEDYKLARLKEGVGRQTINNELTLLRRGFSLAAQRELVPKIPPIVKFANADNVRTGFVTGPEFRRFLKAFEVLDEDAADAARLLFLMGWRLREVLDLVWDEVDLERATVQLPRRRSKNRTARRVPVGKEILQVLQRRWLRKAGDRVFHRRGKPIKSLYGSWRRAAKAIGKPALVPHDARRAFCRAALMAGIPEKVVMEIGGWKTRATFHRYCIVDDEQIREALNSVSDFTNGKLISKA